jgi:hypothetical protein
MKIKFPNYEIELSIEELKELSLNSEIVSEFTQKDSSNKPSVDNSKLGHNKAINKPRSVGSGNYDHKPKIPQEKIDLIKKIFTNYPNRSTRSVAKEINLDNTTVLRWKNRLFPVDTPNGEGW